MILGLIIIKLLLALRWRFWRKIYQEEQVLFQRTINWKMVFLKKAECIAFPGHTFSLCIRMQCLIESSIYLPIRYFSVQIKFTWTKR